MPKMIVSIDGVVLKEVTLAKDRTTLGRRPYNDLVIDRNLLDVVCGDAHIGTLILRRHGLATPQQRVTTKCNQNPHILPQITRQAREDTRTALMVCMRFSAWSNAMQAGDSNTDSVTSMPLASSG